MSQKPKCHHNSSHSLMANNMGDLKDGKGKNRTANMIKTQEKLKHKQSVDLNEMSEKREKKFEKLEAIQESRAKKKKEKDIEIKFNDKEPTSIRLRFKYHPEYLEVGQKLVINELKLVGKVRELYY